MEIGILSVGKIASEWVNKGVEQFNSRIKRYVKYTSIIIPDLKNSKSLSKDNITEEEGKLLLQQIQPSDLVVIMDEKGKHFTSREFADWIQKQMNTGKKRMLFVVGGPFGFSESVYKRADYKVALSKMTFTHEMAKLLLTEQIYRAMTILKGEPYHHD